MKLFGQVIGTLVEVSKLPLDVAKDFVMLMADAAAADVGHRTAERLKEIKKAAKEESPR